MTTIIKVSFDLTQSKDGNAYNELALKIRELKPSVLVEETDIRIHVVGHPVIIGQLLVDTRVEQEEYPISFIGRV